MAARYVRIGQHPDYRDEIRGTLSEILASTANPGTYAAPEDVTGTYLEMGADGLWAGASVGALTRGQADALVASGAMGKVKIGTPAEIDGTHVRWTGTAWQSDLIVGPFADLDAANAWAAANPSSLFPGLLATAAGVQIRWGGSAWAGPRFEGKVGLLGDSLTDKYSSAPAIALASVGKIITNRAQSGKKIVDQTDVKLDALADCRDIYVQVGTNDVLTNDSIPTIYSRYLDLFKRIKSRGHRLFVTLIPYASTFYSGTALANLAAFYAAKDAFADGVFDPYTEFMGADGTASYASADGIHTSNSAKATIAAAYSTKIKGLIFAQPQVRYGTESLLLNGCFITDTNADGLADSWAATSSGTITTIAPSLSAADALGYKKQQFGIAALTGAGSHMLYQDVATGFAAGDLIRGQALIEASIPDTYNDSIWAMMIITCRNSGGATILSSNPFETNNRTSVTAGQMLQSWDFVVPDGTATIRVNLSLKSLGAAAIVSNCTTAFSRAGLYNLTAAGIPAASAITKNY